MSERDGSASAVLGLTSRSLTVKADVPPFRIAVSRASADISTDDRKLDEVTSFKYLKAALCKDGTCRAKSASGLHQQLLVS